MGTHRISLVSVFLVAVLWSAAVAEDVCTLGCKGTPSTPSFLNGHKYNYGVEGTVNVFISGAEKQETGVKMIGQVSVTALGNCAYVLRVTNLLISGPDGKKYNKLSGIEKPVRFTMQDGMIGSQICSEDGDTRRSLNVKRAIISLLQSGQKSTSEVDIFGICPTDTSSSQEGAAVLLHRSRDLNRCAHREHGRNDMVSAIFNPNAEIKNTQIFQSTMNIESKLNNGVPEKVSAIEDYLYKPFSVADSGPKAKVMTKLTLINHAAGTDTGNFKNSKSIIYDNPHGFTMDGSNFNSAMEAVKDTAKTLEKEAGSKSAGQFAQLVRILRLTSKDDLIKIFNAIKGKNVEKRVFLDGLLRAGTSASIETSVHLLKTKELSPLEQKLVFLSLGNAKHVDDDALKAAATLLDLPEVPKEVYLGVGALGGAYCRAHDCSAGSPGIDIISKKLIAKTHHCKPENKIQEDYAVAAFKGLRNIRNLESNHLRVIITCATDASIKSRLRVAALETFLASPCEHKLKEAALKLMKNREEDSEIRIKAYLALIACPCAKSANEIKSLLDTEPVHQVGRFITSSLRHIKSSTNPDKMLAKQHYGLISTPNKFNVDDRKYSYYREASFAMDSWGIGGDVEETVIFSQDSFLPRSASLNLTAELFGHSINVFEIGGRQGNLDRVVEHFLGPKSFLRTTNPQALYDDLVKRFSEAEQKVEGKIRGRRSVVTDIDNFDKQVKDESTPYDNELDMDIYVKLFGTDAIFLSLGDDKGFDFNKVLDQLIHVMETGMNKAKKFQHEVRSHLLFMDTEIAYATSTGFPLKVNLIGSATGRFDVSTNIDFKQIIMDPKNAKIDFKLVPSTDIEVAGHIFVDADAVATGLKVYTNLHSSTGGHVIAKILENGQGFDLQLGLPIDKQEIITASHDLLYFSTEKGHKQKEIPLKIDADRKEYSECFDQLNGVLGITVCGELAVPFSVSGSEAQASIQKFIARYPLTGASKLNLRLEKTDLRGYHIKGVMKMNQPQKKSFELLFEAEGSKNRKTAVAGEIVYTGEEKSLMLSLESPIKTLHGQVAFYTKPNEYAAMVKAKVDKDEYFGRAGFNVQGNNQRKVFKPVMEYQMPGGQGKKSMKVDGQVVREEKGSAIKYSLEGIKINMPNNEIVDIHGDVTMQPDGYEGDIKAKKGEHNMQISGSYKGHDAKLEFLNTLNPYINFKVIAHSENQHGNMHNDFEIFYGGDLKNQQNRVTLNQLLKYHRNSPHDFGFITKNKFMVHALPLKLKIDAEVDPKKVDVEVEGVYVDKSVDFDLEARTQIKKPGDYSVKLVANVDKNGFEAFSKRDIVSVEKSNFENHITIKGLAKYELSGVVLHKTKLHDVNVGAVGHFKVSGGNKNEDIKFDIGAIENHNLYSSHAKISSGKVEFVDFLVKVNRGANPNGQLKVNLKDTIGVNGQFKVTDADGKGNGAIIVDFKKAQKKIKGDIKFLVKEPHYNVDLDLFLNFEKDNNDKIHLSTNTKAAHGTVDSKNKLDYAGKKFELNTKTDYDLKHKENTKMHQVLELVLPNERVLALKMKRETSEKDKAFKGSMDFELSDSEKRGGASSILKYKGKINSKETSENVYDSSYEGQTTLKLKDGRDLQNSYSFKGVGGPSAVKGKMDAKLEVTGSLMPKPAVLSINMDTVKEDKSASVKSHVKANYGSDVTFEWNNQQATSKKDKQTQTTGDCSMQVHLPFETAHDLKFTDNSVFVYYEDPKDTKVVSFTMMKSAQINADTYKVDANGNFGTKTGSGKVKLAIPHVDPFSLDGSYKADFEGEKKAGSLELKSTYGKGKSATIQLDGTTSPSEQTFNIKGHSPQSEKVKKLELSVNTKKLSPDSFSGTVMVDADNRVYKTDAMVVYSKSQPMVDIKYNSPTTKNSRFFLKGNSMSSNQGKLNIKVENVKDFSLDFDSDVSFQKDAVAIKMNANSEKLGWKYNVDIASKDAESGKRLDFHATNNNKNVLSGSTSFIMKQEGPKTIVEGSGSVKVLDEEKSATFKYIRTLLTEGTEQGVETFMNVAIGDRSYVAESRVTNLEFKNSYVYCEEKKQCAHAELNSKIVTPKQGEFQHLVNIGVDLRKLGLAPEFGLQMKSEVSEHRLPQYTMDVHMNKDVNKYHIHVYSTPENGKFPQGITITLPQRVLALESTFSYPVGKSLPFPIEGAVVLHMDKNKPNQKTSLRVLVDVTGKDKTHTAVAELGFSHPKIGKEAVYKFNGKLELPTENRIKIESSSTFSHPSLGGDRESKMIVEASPTKLKVYMSTPLVKIIDLDGSVTIQDNLQQMNLMFSTLESKPVQMMALAKNFNYFEFSSGYTEEQNRKLMIVGHIDPEKKVDFSADIILPNEKKNIIHGALFVQDNLVKSDYGASKDNFNYFVNALKNDLTTLKQRVQQLGEKANTEFKSLRSKIEPNLKKLGDAYKEEIEKLMSELTNDKVLKDMSKALYDVVEFVTNLIKDSMEILRPIVDKMHQMITENSKKITDMYEKQIAPQLKQLYTNVSAIIKEYLDGLIDAVAHFAAIVTDFFEKHKGELQELTNTIGEMFKDINRLIMSQLKELRSSATQIWNEVVNQIKDMPIVQELKARLSELSVPDQFLNVFSDTFQTFRGILPTEDQKNLADAVFNYVMKKLRNQKVDDTAELRKIYDKLVLTINSLVVYVRNSVGHMGVPSFTYNMIPFVTPGQSTPSWGLPAFSFVKQIFSGEVPDVWAMIRSYRPRSLIALEEVPQLLRAVVVNGQHMFTFDGRHFTFPGSCQYVLAHDFVDHNFTLVLQLEKGKPKAILLKEQGGSTVELKDNGQVTLNGAATPLPVLETNTLFAFKDTMGGYGLGSTYGVMVRCSPKLEGCYIQVSGFYLGKLRGLLGDGNNEQYDDFRLPNGKITSSEAEFGNAYRLSPSCAAAITPEHHHHQLHSSTLPKACEQVFGYGSTLKPASLFLDMAPFRQACIHAVSGLSEEAALSEACALGMGYTALATTGLLVAPLPPVCLTCDDVTPARKFGEEYSFKSTGNKADLLVTFETTEKSEMLFKNVLTPLIGQVIDDLKAKNIDDVKVYLVGVTSKMPYPIIYDTDNKLKTAKVSFPDTDRYQYTYPRFIQTRHMNIDKTTETISNLIGDLRVSLGLTNIVTAYYMSLDVPLRPDAAVHIISLVGESCKPHLVGLDIARDALMNIGLTLNGYSHSIIGSTEVEMGGKRAPKVVGFSSDSVIVLGDAKHGKDTKELRETLKYKPDACVSHIEHTNGIVFPWNNFVGMSPADQQQFLSSAATSIVEKMSHPVSRNCRCLHKGPFMARSHCAVDLMANQVKVK